MLWTKVIWLLAKQTSDARCVLLENSFIRFANIWTYQNT